VTHERAWFRSVNGFPGIYLSNLNLKLPSLQRVSLLNEVLNTLAARDGFVVGDYFAESMKARPLIGVLDGG
jgi:hypothetical protein